MRQTCHILAAVSLLAGPIAFAAQTPEEKAFEEKLAAVVPSDRQYEWQLKHDVYAFMVDEVWFDGATPKSKGGQKYADNAWYELIHKLQPKAVIFGKGQHVRWAGNENGLARETEWSVVGLNKPEEETGSEKTCKTLEQQEGHKEQPAPVVGKNPYGKSQISQTRKL